MDQPSGEAGIARRMLAQPTAALYVERFCRNNIEGSKFSYLHLLRYNLASVLTLQRQGLIPRERAARIAGALLDLMRAGPTGIELDPALEDIQPSVERALIERLGPRDGGEVSLGRARFEFGYIGFYLAIREELLEACGKALDATEALLDLADAHRESLASYYTHHIRGEPITLGYYFASIAEGFLASVERLAASYERSRKSPAGIGQIVPTTFPLDRAHLARLLGLEGTVRHSLYGYWNVDVLIDTLGCAALAAAGMGRFASDLYWWSSSDLGLMKWGEEWTGGSFIMPQKRNPSWLKPVRQAAVDATNAHAKATAEYLHTAPMLLVGLIEVPGLTHQGIGDLSYGMEILAKALPTMRLDAQRGRSQASSDFIQAAQLVHFLVKSGQASWRQAEVVVGKFIRGVIARGADASGVKVGDLLAVAKEEGLSLKVSQADLESCFDPAAIVATRGDSGPAPSAVQRACEEHRDDLARYRGWITGERERVARVWEDLESAARQIQGG
jgi:argininosuccinate lyase